MQIQLHLLKYSIYKIINRMDQMETFRLVLNQINKYFLFIREQYLFLD